MILRYLKMVVFKKGSLKTLITLYPKVTCLSTAGNRHCFRLNFITIIPSALLRLLGLLLFLLLVHFLLSIVFCRASLLGLLLLLFLLLRLSHVFNLLCLLQRSFSFGGWLV